MFLSCIQKREENSAAKKSHSLNPNIGEKGGGGSFRFVSLGKEMKLLSEKDHSSVSHLSHSAEP